MTADGRLCFLCPGCGEAHCVPVAPERVPGVAWGYNGNEKIPTITPSISIKTGHYASRFDGGTCYCSRDKSDDPDFADWKCGVCHAVITNGNIAFCADSTHHLSNKTVPLPPWPTVATN